MTIHTSKFVSDARVPTKEIVYRCDQPDRSQSFPVMNGIDVWDLHQQAQAALLDLGPNFKILMNPATLDAYKQWQENEINALAVAIIRDRNGELDEPLKYGYWHPDIVEEAKAIAAHISKSASPVFVQEHQLVYERYVVDLSITIETRSEGYHLDISIKNDGKVFHQKTFEQREQLVDFIKEKLQSNRHLSLKPDVSETFVIYNVPRSHLRLHHLGAGAGM